MALGYLFILFIVFAVVSLLSITLLYVLKKENLKNPKKNKIILV